MLEEARAELVAGHTEAARVRLQRRHVVALELAALEAQVAEVERDESNLRMLEGRLANQVDEFRGAPTGDRGALQRRRGADPDQGSGDGRLPRVRGAHPPPSTEAEEKTEGMEARVSAIDRLVREGLLGVNDQLAEVDDEVDGQLEALERELGR